MRLHLLEVTAFGPFSGTARVDFDRLSDAGLFLLSGATGAGKTSVLDAVCFALYGDVPGDRSAAKRLRADQAEPDVAPRVQLEATLSGRRFRIVRSPSWQRPKKRGSGTTTAQASVLVAERVGGEWVTLATRLDEAGLLISGLVGMNLPQFTQVAMLPQGRFQTFLRSKSDERHKLLHQLFRTGRFEAMESWLRERRVTLRRDVEAAHRAVADLVSRISEAVATPLPEGWDGRDLTAPAADGSLSAWVASLVEEAHEQSALALASAQRTGAAEAGARRAVEDGRVLAARRAALAAARSERAALEEQAEEVLAAIAERDAATRASAVGPVHRLVVRAAEHLARTAAALTDLGVSEADRAELAAEGQRAVAASAAARAALPRERSLAELTHQLDLVAARAEQVEQQVAELLITRAELPARIVAVTARREEASAAAAGMALLASQVQELERRVEAAGVCARLESELVEARNAHLDARETVAQRRDELFELHRSRIEGMAAELAAELAVGASCPVCGSAHHPHKAVSLPGAPDAVKEHDLQRLLDDANLLEHAQSSHVHDLHVQLDQARGRAGDQPAETMRERLRELRDEAATLVERAARLDEVTAELELLSTEDQRLAALLDTLGQTRARLEEQLRHGREQHAVAAAEVAALLDGTGAADLSELLSWEDARTEAALAALRALDQQSAAASAHAEALAALDAAAFAAGFDDAQAALAATRDAARLAELDRGIRDHERRLAALTSVLEAPDVALIEATPEPDLPALESAHAESLEQLTTARAGCERWTQRTERLDDLSGRVTAALAQWRPLHDDWRRTAELAAFCEGKSPDNRLQMRLSAYVLAFRLAQVVAAANERLAGMSDQRYSLEHSGQAGAGENRGGLSLLVRDDWSGESRDPATLSGGETFVVSLALALGLADVITQEAGGADLDTLFVDEGFGSLDADTLDDVLDTLDGLRDGGRVVGVVSHVAEMRDRIPTQLVVTKGRSGSTLAVRG